MIEDWQRLTLETVGYRVFKTNTINREFKNKILADIYSFRHTKQAGLPNISYKLLFMSHYLYNMAM